MNTYRSFRQPIRNGVARRWMQAALILFALSLSALPFFLTQRGLTTTALSLLVGLVAVLIFWRWPALGLVCLVILNLAVPTNISTGFVSIPTAVPLVMLLFGLWIAQQVLARRRSLALSGPILPAIALGLTAIFSFGVGQIPWYPFAEPAPIPAQLAGLGIFILSVATFLLAAQHLHDLRWLKWVTWTFVVLGAVHVVGFFIPFGRDVVARLLPRGAAGSMLWTWLVAISFSQGLLNSRLSRWTRLVLIGITLSVFYISMFHGRRWASGWVPSMFAVVAILLARQPRWGIAAALLASAGLALTPQIIQELIVQENAYSILSRTLAWEILLDIVKVNPVLGLGPANYWWFTRYFPFFGVSVNFNSHNNYIDLLMQTGLLGLSVFLWFAWSLFQQAWGLRARLPSSFTRAFVYGGIGGLAGTMISAMFGDWVLPFVYNIGLNGLRASLFSWLFLGGLTAIALRSEGQKHLSTVPLAQGQIQESEVEWPEGESAGVATSTSERLA